MKIIYLFAIPSGVVSIAIPNSTDDQANGGVSTRVCNWCS